MLEERLEKLESVAGVESHLKELVFSHNATKIATNYYNILILYILNYLEGVAAHGRASSSLAFGTKT